VDVYDEMAEHYDLIYNDLLDLEFYLREARNARGPVLEAACGTGRIYLKLLAEGIDVTGIDLSGNMLEVLKRKAKALKLDPKVFRADMAEFELDGRFRLIIVPYRSFLHLKDDTERKKALRNFMEHLEPGGRLILHTYNLSKDELEMQDDYHPLESEDLVSSDGRKYSLDWYLHYEPKGRMAHYKVVLRFENGAEKEFLMDIAYVPIKDMQALLKSAGCRNIKLYCGFDYSMFDEGCREVLWIAER
jgi:SAM-dependent methyltransferase